MSGSDPGDATGGGHSIVFDDVSVVYPNGTRGLDKVSLTIPAGEFVVVVGLSGAGKSTLVRTINGLVPVTSGSLSVGGTEVASRGRAGRAMPAARRPGPLRSDPHPAALSSVNGQHRAASLLRLARHALGRRSRRQPLPARPLRGRQLRRLRAEIGMIFQGFNLVTRRSVMGNVLTGRLHAQSWLRSAFGLHTKADKEIAFEALERVGIVEKAWVRASQLSGGQQQRVAIARALAQQPSVVLADEPVASLDPPTANLVMRDLQRINRDLGITTVVNLHFLDLARRYADRIIGMRAGEVVFDGPAADADDAVFERIYGRSLTAEDVLA